MDRRAFIGTCALGLLAGDHVVNAQTTAKRPTVGWLSGGFAARQDSPPHRAFVEGLRDSGYIVGQNVLLNVESPQRNEPEAYSSLATKLVAQHVAVILAGNPHSLSAAARATSSIPIVGVDLESDPMAKGWVASLARPGRNTTGFFLDIPEMSGKLMQFLAEIRPGLNRVAILGDPRINELQFRATEAAASRAGFTVQLSHVIRPTRYRGRLPRQRCGGQKG